jgi:transposase
MTGRPTKLTPEIHRAIVTALEAGNYQDDSAAYAGVSTSALYNWLARGRTERERIEAGEKPRKAETVFVDFLDAVESARAKAAVRHVANIAKAANEGVWQASAWYLERSYPQKWGRLNRTEISGPDGGPIEARIDLDALDDKLTKLLGLED